MSPHPIIADLRHLRESRGVSQPTLARQLGVSQVTVQSWEAGRRNPSLDHLAAWAQILGADLTATPQTKEQAA